ncbi:MAG: hypothetical protein R3B48_15560 [Kofleriaceae bacterium]
MIDLGQLGQARGRGLARKGPGLGTLQDPAAFFDITYPTVEIVETLKTLSRRIATPEAVPGTILLSGRYGHGKSHVLLAAHHALNAPAAAQAWATRWKLGELRLPENPIVVTRSFIQHAEEPLWDMLIGALATGRKPKIGDFPDGELIGSLLGERPVFVIMDELERWYDAQDDRTKSRNRNFLQALTEVSMRDGRLTILTSVLGEKEEPAETIRRVKPLELSFRSAEDRQRVALFRLFTNRDDAAAERAAGEVADAYLAAYANAGIKNTDALRSRMIATWPFTPEFLDTLTKKVPSLGGFQNTRGILRFLAYVVKHTADRRPIISSQDLPFQDDAIHGTLSNLDATGGEVVRRALGDNYEAVGSDLPHRDELFSALTFYSIADPTHPGATLEELLLATVDPGENVLRIRDSLAQLKQRAFNLHERDERFVFLAVENPHARINAMAASQLVSREAARDHILDTLGELWGAKDRTAFYLPMEWDALQERLRALRNVRPRIVLSTVVLTAQERLRIQNLDERRNLVLLVEPHVRTSTGESQYRLLSDEELLHHARRLEACILLLEGKPAKAAADVYRQVKVDELERLRKAIGDRYGVAISWNRAGATGTAIDSSWFELHRLEKPTAEALLEKWRNDLSSLPDVTAAVRARWSDFRNRTVADLEAWFESTPGQPVPLESTWVTSSVRTLIKDKVFSVIGADGAVWSASTAGASSDDQLRRCTIAEPLADVVETTKDGPEAPIVHARASAQYDAGARGVLVSWAYPPSPAPGTKFETFVQRYTSARNWQVGRTYPIDTGATHEANRYHGPDESFVDKEKLQPGEWYLYYVFLVRRDPDGTTTYTLSQRCDASVPKEGAAVPGVLESQIHSDLNKLVAEVEKTVMSGKMSADARVRKLEIEILDVTDPIVRTQLSGSLAEALKDKLEASGDLRLTIRGEYNRQEVIGLVRKVPRYEGARYRARLHLKTENEREPRS